MCLFPERLNKQHINITDQKITKNHKKSQKNHKKSLKNHKKSPKTSPKIINNHQQYPPTNWHDQNHQKLSNICQICKKNTKNHQKIIKNHQQHPPINWCVPPIWLLVIICISYEVCKGEKCSIQFCFLTGKYSFLLVTAVIWGQYAIITSYFGRFCPTRSLILLDLEPTLARNCTRKLCDSLLSSNLLRFSCCAINENQALLFQPNTM